MLEKEKEKSTQRKTFCKDIESNEYKLGAFRPVLQGCDEMLGLWQPDKYVIAHIKLPNSSDHSC